MTTARRQPGDRLGRRRAAARGGRCRPGRNTIMSLRPLPGGDLLVAARGPLARPARRPTARRAGANGRSRWTRAASESNLGLSADGMVVDFGYELWGEGRARFDLATLTLTADPPDDGRTAPPVQAGAAGHRLGGQLRAPRSTASRCRSSPTRSRAAWRSHPDGKRFVLGAEWSLRAFDAAGTELWRRRGAGRRLGGEHLRRRPAGARGLRRRHASAGTGWRTAPRSSRSSRSPTGRTGWPGPPRGSMPPRPARASVLRWHVNHGWDAAGEAIPVSAIPETHRPEVIQAVLPQLGTAGALAVAELAKIRGAVQAATKAAVPPGARLHVLTVGVGDYGRRRRSCSSTTPTTTPTTSPRTLLTSQSGLYAEVLPQLLLNADATRGGILRRARPACARAWPRASGDDLAVVAFSGHGAMIDDMFYLLPHDVDAGDPVAIQQLGARRSTTSSARSASLAEHGRVIVLLDACHSGATTGSGAALAADADRLRELMRGPNVDVLTSSTADQLSVEDRQWRNGAFTEAVLEALTTRADERPQRRDQHGRDDRLRHRRGCRRSPAASRPRASTCASRATSSSPGSETTQNEGGPKA